MSKSIITNSGRRFGEKVETPKETQKRIAKENFAKEQAEFAEKCVCYTIPPEFYGMECMDAFGEIFLLVGLDEDYAVLRETNGKDRTTKVPFENAMDMIIAESQMELDEMESRIALMYADIKECKVRTEVRRDIRYRINSARQAKEMYNSHMGRILAEMNLPTSMLRAGWKLRFKTSDTYELVSYREDKKTQENYILENICKPSVDPTRFKSVTFDKLKEGMSNFAIAFNDSETLKLIEGMTAVEPSIINVVVSTGADGEDSEDSDEAAGEALRMEASLFDLYGYM